MSSVVPSKSLALVSAAAALASVSEARAVFHKVSAAKTWTEANQFCLDKYDTVLVGVTSASENAEYKGLTTNVYAGSSWLGLNDALFEGVWNNVGGESALSYSNWYPGQPNDWGSAGQDCGYMQPDGSWADHASTTKMPGFFCQAPAWLPASTIGGDDWVLVHGVGSKTWSDAQQYCADVEFGSTLASVHSSTQNTDMWNAMQNRGHNRAFIGLNDFSSEGTWVWSDGSSVGYTNFASGQPDNYGGAQDVAVIWEKPAGTWDDDSSSKTYAAFFCKV